MEREAVVTRVEGSQAYVEFLGETAGCGRCHETGGCQSGMLGQLFCSKPRLFRLDNPIDAAPGERVVVRVEEGAALRAALQAYVLPLAFLLLGALAGASMGEAGGEDAATAMGALAGIIAGVVAGLTFRRAPFGRIAPPVLIRRIQAFRTTREIHQ